MVTSFKLLEVAAQAELLRWKQEARRIARNSALMAGAGLFLLFALALLHVAALVWIAGHTGYAAAALWVTLGDVIIAAILFVASRKKTDAVAMEALRIRRRAIHELGASTVAGDVVRVIRRDQPAHTIGGSIAETLVRTVVRR